MLWLESVWMLTPSIPSTPDIKSWIVIGPLCNHFGCQKPGSFGFLQDSWCCNSAAHAAQPAKLSSDQVGWEYRIWNYGPKPGLVNASSAEYLQSWLRPSAAPKRPHSVSSRKNWSFWGHQWKTSSGISTIYGTWIMSSLLRPAFDLFLGAVTVPRSTGGWASYLVMWCIYSGRISDTVREHAWWILVRMKAT